MQCLVLKNLNIFSSHYNTIFTFHDPSITYPSVADKVRFTAILVAVGLVAESVNQKFKECSVGNG